MAKRGYTILETVVYVTILAVIAILVLGSIFSIYRAFGKTKIERELALNGDVALETIIREIRSATSSDAAASVFGSSPGVLKVNINNSTEKFSLSGGGLQIQRGAGAAESLTSSDVSVTNLTFYSSTTPNSEIIKIQLTLQAGTGIFLKTKNFYGSAVMRGAY